MPEFAELFDEWFVANTGEGGPVYRCLSEAFRGGWNAHVGAAQQVAEADANADIVSSLLRVAAYLRTNKCVSPYRDAGQWLRDVADKLDYIARYAAGVRAA